MSIPLQFSSLYDGQEVFVRSGCLLDLGTDRTSSLVTWSLYEMRSILRQHLISMDSFLLCFSAVRVHDSHAYRKMDVIRVSRILELREMLLSFQTGFSLVNAAVVYVILESIPGLELSSVLGT